MRLLYLGEMTMNSMFVECLIDSGKFTRVDHFIKQTLEMGHIGMNPQPDAIIIKCSYEGEELEWAKRYSPEIPKIFLVCNDCLEQRGLEYQKLGVIYNTDAAMALGDLTFRSLIRLIIKYDEQVIEQNGEQDEL